MSLEIPIAQSAERAMRNLRGVGSSPTWDKIFLPQVRFELKISKLTKFNNKSQ
jgi:hypothetical protein